MPHYHILSLDGGGIRGVLTANLLELLEDQHPGFLGKVELIAGTSTGGILALALASGMTPKETGQLYENLGPAVFKDSIWDDIVDVVQLRGAQYDNKPLKKELEDTFGDMRLRDLEKRVLIGSFDLDNEETRPGKARSWKPKFFHNFPGKGSDKDELVVDVALYTSAAPTFFPVYRGFIDGGVVANNPSMCALAQALEKDTGNQKLRDIRMLSVGTGVNPKIVEAENDDWGLIQWAPHLVSLMLEGSVGLADYQCSQALYRRYHRLNPVLPVPIGLDGLDQIPLMKEIAAETDLKETLKWLRWYFRIPKDA